MYNVNIRICMAMARLLPTRHMYMYNMHVLCIFVSYICHAVENTEFDPAWSWTRLYILVNTLFLVIYQQIRSQTSPISVRCPRWRVWLILHRPSLTPKARCCCNRLMTTQSTMEYVIHSCPLAPVEFRGPVSSVNFDQNLRHHRVRLKKYCRMVLWWPHSDTNWLRNLKIKKIHSIEHRHRAIDYGTPPMPMVLCLSPV